MKISDLIKELERIVEEVGDFPVYVESWEGEPFADRPGLLDVCFRFVVGDGRYAQFSDHISRTAWLSLNNKYRS